MAPARLLHRNVRPMTVVEEEEDEFKEDEFEEEVQSEFDAESSGAVSDEGSRSEKSDIDSDDEAAVEEQLGNVSFRALKQAQDSLPIKRKRGSDSALQPGDRLDSLRQRLRQLREARTTDQPAKSSRRTPKQSAENPAGPPKTSIAHRDHDGTDSAPASSEEAAPTHARTSKHAPTAQSSKHQVTRKRSAVSVPKRHTRDPRFDPAPVSPASAAHHRHAYSFLSAYRAAELASLRTALAGRSSARDDDDDDDKSALRRALNARENLLQSDAAQERARDVLRRHRADEREAVRAGKRPFFLKRGELKRRELVERFGAMTGRERTRVVERRTMREGQRARRRMPRDRRTEG